MKPDLAKVVEDIVREGVPLKRPPAQQEKQHGADQPAAPEPAPRGQRPWYVPDFG